jgi:uncharacterized protein (TIGR00369 family)
MKLEPGPTNPCFGCGGANPRGMKLSFELDEVGQRVRGAFRAGAEYQGGPGFVHGGIIATLLDEVMGKVNRFRNVRAVTAELHIEYLRPVPIEQEVLLEAWPVENKGRSLYNSGEIREASGAVLARGKGRFVIIDPERYYPRAGDANKS